MQQDSMMKKVKVSAQNLESAAADVMDSQGRLPLSFMIGAENVEVECLIRKLVLTTGILNQHLTLAAHTDDPEPLSRIELEAINHELSDVLWKLKAGVHGVEKARTLQ